MATVKKTKAKNLSAGPSKMTKKAGPIDPKGQWTEVQERTLGNMKKGGKVKKAQNGVKTTYAHPPLSSGLTIGKKAGERKTAAAKSKYEASSNPKVEYNVAKQKSPGGPIGGQKVSVDTTGLAAGEKRFPVKMTTRKGKDVYYETNRPQAKSAVRVSQQRKGGKTSKKK